MTEFRYECTCSCDENAIKVFNDTLIAFPNISGIGFVSIEGFCSQCYYNQTTNKFEKITFYTGGYRRDSLSSSKELTPDEEIELYKDVSRGGISVMCRYKISHKTAGLKDYRILNISPHKTHH